MAAFAGVVALGAIYGGYRLLADPVGLGVKQAWLDGTPFPDYTVPGITLLVVIGGGMLFTAAAAVRGAPVASPAALVMGLALLGWGSVETLTTGYQGRPQILLLAAFVVGPAVPLLRIGWRSTRRSRSRARALDHERRSGRSVIPRTEARAHSDADPRVRAYVERVTTAPTRKGSP